MWGALLCNLGNVQYPTKRTQHKPQPTRHDLTPPYYPPVASPSPSMGRLVAPQNSWHRSSLSLFSHSLYKLLVLVPPLLAPLFGSTSEATSKKERRMVSWPWVAKPLYENIRINQELVLVVGGILEEARWGWSLWGTPSHHFGHQMELSITMDTK